MGLIVLQVRRSLGRWAVMHGDQALATFETREAAERAALALAVVHPEGAAAEVDLTDRGEALRSIHVF